MIPRGLRITKFPSFGKDNPNFQNKWEAILNKCSLYFTVLLIEKAKKQRAELRNHIEEMKRLSRMAPECSRQTVSEEKKLREDIDKLAQTRMYMFKWDKRDYREVVIYSWLYTYNCSSYRNRQAHSVSFSLLSSATASQDEEVSPSTSAWPFLDNVTDTVHTKGKQDGADRGRRWPPDFHLWPQKFRQAQTMRRSSIYQLHLFYTDCLQVLSKRLSLCPYLPNKCFSDKSRPIQFLPQLAFKGMVPYSLYVPKSYFFPINNNACLNAFMKEVNNDVDKLSQVKRTYSNLTSGERYAIQWLKPNDYLVMRSVDKGWATVVWGKRQNIDEAFRQFSDPQYYVPLTLNPTKLIEHELKDMVTLLLKINGSQIKNVTSSCLKTLDKQYFICFTKLWQRHYHWATSSSNQWPAFWKHNFRTPHVLKKLE